MSKQIVVKPQGLITEPNKVGQFPPGAFATCNNVAIRSFGVMEQVRKFAYSGYGFSGPLIGGAYVISEGPLTLIVYEHTTAGTWAIFGLIAGPGNTLGGYTRSVAAPFNSYITNDCRTGLVLMRNRLIVSGSVRSFVFDITVNETTPSVSISAARECGVYQTMLADRTASFGVVGDPPQLGPNEHFSATSVLRLVFPDGYEIQGPPSVPSDYPNLSTTLPQVRSLWYIYSELQPSAFSGSGEVKHDVYRTRAQSVGYDSVGNKYNPVSTGSSFYLSKTADRTGTSQNLEDTTLPSTLGEALLTNVSVGGASALPLPPPPTARASAAFRGHAFYANYFDPATFTLLNPYYWGFIDMATASVALRTYGIGYRITNSGQTATNGNPTVTGLPNTTGVKVGQRFAFYRVDTGVIVSGSFNEVLSFTATTITGTINSTYTGAVRVQLLDMIEVCGSLRAALDSPQDFVRQLFIPGFTPLNLILDVAAVGLEPITSDNPVGVYPNFVPTGGLTFRMRTNAPFTIRATNGANFSPALPEIGATALSIPGKQKLNAIAWSENNEPENCPPSNYAFIGSGEIYKSIASRDCLWFFCSDGLYRLSGAGGSVGDGYDWVIDPVDPSLVITNPMCAVTYREYVYAFTNRGVVSISSEGVVRELSDGRINPSWGESGSLIDYTLQNRPWNIKANPPAINSWPWMTADAFNDEIWVRDITSNNSDQDKIWIYNTKTDTWCTRVPSYSGSTVPMLGIYNSTAQVVLCLFSNLNLLIASASLGNSTDYEIADVTFQPFYGNGNGAAYTQKHWQDINLSFRTPQTSSVAACELRSQNFFNSLSSTGSRLIPTGTPSALTQEESRVGFTVPRNWPALSNAIAPAMRITSPSNTGPAAGLQPIKFEGMSISYVEFAEQRVKR